jgi:hypothetical protein
VTVVSTTDSGILASRLLKSGLTPADVSAHLSAKFEIEIADIQPLLKALYKARMIRSINGETVEADAPSLMRQLIQRLEWIRIRAGALFVGPLSESPKSPSRTAHVYLLRPIWSNTNRRYSHKPGGI